MIALFFPPYNFVIFRKFPHFPLNLHPIQRRGLAAYNVFTYLTPVWSKLTESSYSGHYVPTVKYQGTAPTSLHFFPLWLTIWHGALMAKKTIYILERVGGGWNIASERTKGRTHRSTYTG